MQCRRAKQNLQRRACREEKPGRFVYYGSRTLPTEIVSSILIHWATHPAGSTLGRVARQDRRHRQLNTLALSNPYSKRVDGRTEATEDIRAMQIDDLVRVRQDSLSSKSGRLLLCSEAPTQVRRY